jgi:hypothetical protein
MTDLARCTAGIVSAIWINPAAAVAAAWGAVWQAVQTYIRRIWRFTWRTNQVTGTENIIPKTIKQ